MPRPSTKVGPDTTSVEPAESNTMRKQPSACTRRDKEAHGTPEQPSETRVSRHKHQHTRPPRGPPQTSTRSRGHKQKHPGPWTCHEVRELHPKVPPQTAPRNGL
ncbi:hypothetical protein Taro_009758 [Colocasia esculenta]|uniref:Uncharacterized protein n=1 Tax=Colocasia esculenta TaxID=4460 RepID=A0A843TX54_COLES|nr:hypothetical protein [Colocasia esculenta]